MRLVILLAVLCLAAFSVALPLPLAAEPAAETPAALRQRVQALVAETRLVGGAYAIVRAGEIVAVEPFGTVAPGGLPVTRATPFRAGSVSKTVTSMLLVSLAAEGALGLDDPVAPLLPGVALDNPWAADGGPTIRQLLEHTAGLQATSYPDFADHPVDIAPLEAARLHGATVAWAPGKHFLYANHGHTLAAAAAETAAGQPFDALVRGRVLDPLGMRGATFRLDDPRAADLAPSFETDGTDAGVWHMAWRPSGAMVATIDDLAALTRFHASAGRPTAIAPAAMIEAMRHPQTGLAARAGYPHAYALGLFAFVEAGQVWWGHWGRVDGFLTSFGVLPDRGDGFAVVVNSGDRRAFAALRGQIAAHVAGDPPSDPPAAAPPAAAGRQDPVSVPGSDPDPEADPDPEIGRLVGWWAPLTPETSVRAWIMWAAGLTAIEPAGDGLIARAPPLIGAPHRLVATAPGFYRQQGFPIETHLFVEDGGRTVLIGDEQQSFERLSAAAIALLALGGAWGVAGLFCGLVGGLWNGLRAAVRRGRPSGALWMLLGLAAMATLGLIALFATWGLFASLADLALLSRPGLRALALSGLSVVPALCVAGAAIVLWRRWRGIGRAGRALAVFALAGQTVVIGMLASQGWLPLTTWTA
ncbi:MAG: serine hydrolase domain-containing protein [Pseudomonadota bacterium]